MKNKMFILFLFLLGITTACTITQEEPKNETWYFDKNILVKVNVSDLVTFETLNISIDETELVYTWFNIDNSNFTYIEIIRLNNTENITDNSHQLKIICKLAGVETGGKTTKFYVYSGGHTLAGFNIPPLILLYFLLPIIALLENDLLFGIILISPLLIIQTLPQHSIFDIAIIFAFLGIILRAVRYTIFRVEK